MYENQLGTRFGRFARWTGRKLISLTVNGWCMGINLVKGMVGLVKGLVIGQYI